MINYYIILIILFGHWVYDFFLQTDDMAKNKSHDNGALLAHVFMYFYGLCIMASATHMFFPSVINAIAWILVNTVAHFFTDYCSSRASSLLWKEGKVHDFFVIIGADQLIHYATLFGTFIFLTSK